ncbi:TIGR02206 family membrane protein [Evansella clarkii]|uniref:YwaF family protein n=1 Tax=Evansella clarkii TaxID=79879 RepID=UPI0009975864|nr:TIGR02206 family membrane protein [Evansella clarkii]
MLEQFFHPETFREDAIFLSTPHVGVLIIFFSAVISLYLNRNNQYIYSVRWILLLIIIISEISLQIWSMITGQWSIQNYLPLHLSNLSLYLCAYMLWKNSFKVFEVLYFFGIGGVMQALLTPDLFYTFPHYRFFHFFLAHMAVVLGILYMVWVKKYTVTIKSAIKSYAVINVIAFFVFWINQLIGSNYMFLSEKPSGPSLLDYLGPFPWYIFQMQLIAAGVYLILYLPFYFKNRTA